MAMQKLDFSDLTIADSINLQRRVLKISQTQLAIWAGVSRNYISLIECGKTDGLTIGTLYKICRALKLDINIVITARDAPNIVCTGLATPDSDGGLAQNASR